MSNPGRVGDMAGQPKKTTTPELEELRQEQVKKRSGADPAQVLDKAIYQLWETINDLDQITPDRVEHYRVSIFGSSRIRRGDPIYEEVKSLSFELARMGFDIVTGGGPGLMEAANSGATEGQIESKARSFGLAMHLPTEDQANAVVGVHRHAWRHRIGAGAVHGVAAFTGQAHDRTSADPRRYYVGRPDRMDRPGDGPEGPLRPAGPRHRLGGRFLKGSHSHHQRFVRALQRRERECPRRNRFLKR